MGVQKQRMLIEEQMVFEKELPHLCQNDSLQVLLRQLESEMVIQ